MIPATTLPWVRVRRVMPPPVSRRPDRAGEHARLGRRFSKRPATHGATRLIPFPRPRDGNSRYSRLRGGHPEATDRRECSPRATTPIWEFATKFVEGSTRAIPDLHAADARGR